MNERIRELALQAMTYVTHNPKANKLNSGDMFDEKFAELIIREYSYDVMNLTSMPKHVEIAAKHWGVEL